MQRLPLRVIFARFSLLVTVADVMLVELSLQRFRQLATLATFVSQRLLRIAAQAARQHKVMGSLRRIFLPGGYPPIVG
jgi:hypothetical protein